MSWWSKGEDNEAEGEDGDEGDDEDYKTGVDKLIFLIDARVSMISNKFSSGECHLINSLKIALSVMKSKIIASENSFIGITFFGTREKEANGSNDNVYNLFSLAPPTATRIRQLQSLINDPNLTTFLKDIGSQDLDSPCPLKRAFWASSQAYDMKSSTKASSDFHRIWLFTNEDDPFSRDPVEKSHVLQVCRDCAQKGIEISLWSLDKPPMRFNIFRFYRELLVSSRIAEDDEEGDLATVDEAIEQRTMSSGLEGFDPNIANIRKKQFKKRVLTRLLWSFADACKGTIKTEANSDSSVVVDTKISVGVYKTIHVFRKPLHSWLYSHSNEPVKTISKYIDGATGEGLEERQIHTYLEAGGVEFPISKEDYNTVKNRPFQELFSSPLSEESSGASDGHVGIRTLFCTPLTHIARHLNISEPYFIFPDESIIKGSKEFFSILHQEAYDKKLAIIVSFRRSKTENASTMIAALYPIKSDDLEGGGASGFYLIPLPYAEDLRYRMTFPTKNEDTINRLAINFEDLISRMQFEDDFRFERDVENPAIQKYFGVLQAVALGETSIGWTEVEDKMQPDAESLEAVKDLFVEIRDISGLQEGDMTIEKKEPRKRVKADDHDDDGNGPPSKKVKSQTSASVSKEEESEYRQMIQSNEISKLTVARLKDICGSLGLAVSGTKAVLIDRISQKLL